MPHFYWRTSTGEYVNSLTILVRDEKGELFSFNDFPLEFEIEIKIKKVMYTKLRWSMCCHNQLWNTVIQRTITPYCLSPPKNI